MANISQQFIHKMRGYVRVGHNLHDGELIDLIEAARADLITLGGLKAEKVNDESDALIKRAIGCYIKAEYGLDNPDAEKYRQSYEALKQHLMLSNEYKKGA